MHSILLLLAAPSECRTNRTKTGTLEKKKTGCQEWALAPSFVPFLKYVSLRGWPCRKSLVCITVGSSSKSGGLNTIIYDHPFPSPLAPAVDQ